MAEQQRSKTPQLFKDFKHYLDDEGVDYNTSFSKQNQSYTLASTYQIGDKKFEIRLFTSKENSLAIAIDGFDQIPADRYFDFLRLMNSLSIDTYLFKFVFNINSGSPVMVYEPPEGLKTPLPLLKKLWESGKKQTKKVNDIIVKFLNYRPTAYERLEEIKAEFDKSNIPTKLVKATKDADDMLIAPIQDNCTATIFCDAGVNRISIIINNYGICPKDSRDACLKLLNKLNREIVYKFYLYQDQIRAIRQLQVDSDFQKTIRLVLSDCCNVHDAFNDIRQQISETISVKVSLD